MAKANRKQFDQIIAKWYLHSYEYMVSCLYKAEKMYPDLPDEDQPYAMKIIKMIRGAKVRCDEVIEDVWVRYEQ